MTQPTDKRPSWPSKHPIGGRGKLNPANMTPRRRPSTDCYLSCLALILHLILGAIGSTECLSSQQQSPSDRIYSIRSPATNPSDFKKGKDYKEIFDKLTIQVRENTQIGSKLADFDAHDPDWPGVPITYAVVSGPDAKSFECQKDSATNKYELFSLVSFDFEVRKTNYQFKVRGTSPFLRHELDVDVIVLDENDNKPQLDDFSIIFNNYKNNFPPGPIGRVPASDADTNDQLRYRVLSGNNAQLIVVNETTGDIHLSPLLNSNVPYVALLTVGVSDGTNEDVAQVLLKVNLVTETMLQNSVVLRLDGIGREEFLTGKYDDFVKCMARILNLNGKNDYIVVFDVEESLVQEPSEPLAYRTYLGTSLASAGSSVNSTLSVNVSFSARDHGNDVELYLSSQYIEERIYLHRMQLMRELNVYVAPFQDNACVREPCSNYQDCQASYRFERAPKTFITTKNMIFRPIKAVQTYACSCPPTFTGMKHRAECNLQINPCFSNPCVNGGICHRHESGYSCECGAEHFGPNCEHSFVNSTCQSVSLSPLIQQNLIEDSPAPRRSPSVCGSKARCVNSNRSQSYPASKSIGLSGPSTGSSTSLSNGISCQDCPFPQYSTDLCQLRTRSFSKNSYITLPSLRRRHRFHIMLKFTTIQNDALLFYNGRYNDNHDFIALEIKNSHLQFSYSLGSTITTVCLSTISVSDGNWHKVAIDYRDRNVTLLVDDCDPVIDEALARIQGSTGQMKRCSNTSVADPNAQSEFKTLDLSSPMQIGALLPLPTEFQISSQSSFVGCLSDLYIDHQLVDLYNPIQDVGTQIGCPEKRSYCQPPSCNGFPCQDAFGSAKCSCGDDHLGKSCEILINDEKVRKFNGNSYLSFNPIESTISANWIVSLHFRTINPNGSLMKIYLDPEVSIMLELQNSGLRLSYRSRSIMFNKVNLDDGDWHFVELTWTPDSVQLQIDYNPNLSVTSNDMGSVAGSVVRSVTIGASPPSRVSSMYASSDPATPSEGTDFSSSIASSGLLAAGDSAFNSPYGLILNASSPSFVGCIYGVNVSDSIDSWLSPSEERNMERGCQVADVCEAHDCPPNSRCVRRGMNQRRCLCNPGYIGERCLPICELSPCQGDSRCISTAVQTAPNQPQASDTIVTTQDAINYSGQYQCECEPHRTGKNCEHQLSPRCPSNWWGKPVAGGNSSICGPCNCDESKGFDGDCDKLTGQCFCKQNYYQPLGSDSCLACDCYAVGSLSASCNQTTGQCKCRPGVVGRRCDTCASNIAEVTLRGCEVVYNACPKTFSDGIWWEKTQPDKLVSQLCPPSTSTGSASRYCNKDREWQKANLFDCISNTFTDLYNHYQMFEESKFPMTSSLAIKIASNLRFALNETVSNPAMQLYGSDIYISFRLIHHLIQHESRQTGLNLTHRQDRMYTRNIAESINYILDPAYADNWPEISSRSPNGGAEHLLKLIDTYGKVLIESQSDTYTQPFEVATKHFTFGMDTMSTEQLWDMNKAQSFSGQMPPPPPYATDPFGPYLDQMNPTTTAGSSRDIQNYNADGSSVFLDYSSTARDASPAVIIPKYDNYALDLAINQDDKTKSLIPVKTLRIKTLQEQIPQSYYQTAKSRAKREELIIPDYRYSRQPQQQALVVYSIFRSLGPLLPSEYDNTVQNRLGVMAVSNSPVVWLTVRPANSSEFLSKNIQPKITYMLKMVEPVGKIRPQCAIWTFNQPSSNPVSSHKVQDNSSTASLTPGYGIKKTGRFSTRGCELKGILPNHKLRYKYDYVNCSCDHIGAVTVLMNTANYDYLVGEETGAKDLALIISLGISLSLLVATLFTLSCVRSHSIKSNSNSINKNLVLILIAIESLVLYAIVSRNSLNQREYQCQLVAIFLHYFSVSLFFWLLVNAIHFYRMLTELRDINHGPMKFYQVLGYAIPATFVAIAVGLRIEQFGNYLFCWLSIHEPIIWSMFGPICFVSIITIILFMLALCKSLPIKMESDGAELVKNHMFINIVKTPLIGIYWLITVYAVNEALVESVHLFPTVIIAKSICLFILLCIVDKHIRYNLYVSWLRFKGDKVEFMDESINHNTDSAQWTSALGMPGTLNKNYASYVSHNGQINTPGFQDSCRDIFQPGVIAFSAASTTSRSTATGTSSGAAYKYRSHRVKDRVVDEDYGRSSGRHGRRRHKKSHKRHHHHKHHHHHHHRSHYHHDSHDQVDDSYEQHHSRRRSNPNYEGVRENGHHGHRSRHGHHRHHGQNIYGSNNLEQQSHSNNSNSQQDLTSSRSSDNDANSSTALKTKIDTQTYGASSTNQLIGSSPQDESPLQLQLAGPSGQQLDTHLHGTGQQHQTTPMELMTSSSPQGQQSTGSPSVGLVAAATSHYNQLSSKSTSNDTTATQSNA